MNLINYTGKLNEHEQYVNMLDKIERYCKYIEIVIVLGGKTNELVDKFKDDILEIKQTSKWWGTQTKSVNMLYKIKSSKLLFEELKKYETFCKYYEYGSNNKSLLRGDHAETTDFGFDDIAFYDKNDNYILFTTTHEGFITLNDKFLG